MKVTYWGTRGSQASPGPDTVRYGGNTACVELHNQAGHRLVLDAGTGIRRLGLTIAAECGRVDVLLSHLHLDHIQGLGFFGPLYRPECEVHLWGPGSTMTTLRERLGRYLSPPLFPVRLRDLPCRLVLHDLPHEPLEIPGFDVRAQLVCHPGATYGYRVLADGVSVTYLSDHEPALGVRTFPRDPSWTSGFDLAADTDLLIHDAQYTDAEYATRVGWGHSTLAHAVAFTRLVRARRFAPFHFDPIHDDDLLDRLHAQARAALFDQCDVVPAREGDTVDVVATATVVPA